MDPNEALRRVRESVGEILNQDDDGIIDSTTQVGQLIESFDALDEWLTKGGFPPADWDHRPKPGPHVTGAIGVTDASGRMVWRYDYEHTHEYQGQKLTHSHKHSGPHGYFEHPEDVGAPGTQEPGFDTDVPYSRKEG